MSNNKSLIKAYVKGVLKESQAKTLPASKSEEEQELKATYPAWGKTEIENLSGHPASAVSVKTKTYAQNKFKLVKDELEKRGYMDTAENAKTVNQKLYQYIISLGPETALISSASDIARQFASDELTK